MDILSVARDPAARRHSVSETSTTQETLRLMAVHAHPDDESSKGAATMCRYVAEGVDVMVVTCTGGERGSVLNPKLDRPEILAEHHRDPARRDGPGAGDPRRHAGVAGLRRLRPSRGRPAAAAAGGLLRPGRPDHRGRATGAADTRVPPARRDHLRRERWLPPPRPHHVPQRERGRLRRRRRSGSVSRAPGSRGSR